MNIDVEQWPVVTEIKEAGRYFAVNKNDPTDSWDILDYEVSESVHSELEVRGPVHFGPCAPHLDLSRLDLSKYPVASQPNSPGMWLCVRDGKAVACCSVEQWELNEGRMWCSGAWQRIGDYTPPPAPLPPVPEVTLHRVTHTRLGETEWVIESKTEFEWWIVLGGARQWRKDSCIEAGSPVTLKPSKE